MRYSLAKEDQADYLFESLLIMAIQITLCTLTWVYIADKGDDNNEKEITASYTNDF